MTAKTDISKTKDRDDEPCPKCGYCPHCGRSNQQAQPYYVPAPYPEPPVPSPPLPWVYPVSPYWVSSGGTTMPVKEWTLPNATTITGVTMTNTGTDA